MKGQLDDKVAIVTNGSMGSEHHRTSMVAVNLSRLSLIATGVAMTAAVAHLMELPAKMRYEASLWVKLHRTLYSNFGRISGPAEAAAVISTSVLVWLRRRRSEAFRPTAVAATCLASTHAIYWTIVQPVNVEVMQWPLDAMPRDWSKWRDRWEYGHALRAGLVASAFVALALLHACPSGTTASESSTSTTGPPLKPETPRWIE